ncbi:MAG: 2Fe-2S iron-sulfur cluster-binding protein [Pseudonocardiaceae bacterium]
MAEASPRPAGASRIWAGGICTTVMVTLVSLMARVGGSPRTAVVHDPAVWRYAARASGLLALVLLSASVLGGLLMSTKLIRGASRQWMQGLHEYLGALAVVFTVIHLVSVLVAPTLGIGVLQLFVPFTRQGNPVAQGLGVLAFYLLTAVLLTSWARAKLPWRWWRRVHFLAFPSWVLAGVHTALTGSDASNPVLQWASLVVGNAILFLAVVRLLTARPATPAGMCLLISQTTWEADEIVSLRLHAPDGSPLPKWEPGAHLELALTSGRRRHYSLCGDPTDTRSYRIAVLQVLRGRGGSKEVHARARAGQLVTVTGPRNYFPLVDSSAYLFIAGGIGITAILAMAARVASAGAEWTLVYTGRRRASMAFLDELRALDPDRVDIVPGNERGRPDLKAIIRAAAPDTAVYCCGPDLLLNAVKKLVAARPDLSMHSERFTVASTVAGGAPFTVELSKTRHIIDVPADRTLLQAIREVLPDVPAGCEQGVCGICRTKVLAGEPEHRDNLLSDAERADGIMLICVSRARSERLTLDL